MSKEKSLKVLIREGLQYDGSHHKQWYLEQIAKELDIDLNFSYREEVPP